MQAWTLLWPVTNFLGTTCRNSARHFLATCQRHPPFRIFSKCLRTHLIFICDSSNNLDGPFGSLELFSLTAATACGCSQPDEDTANVLQSQCKNSASASRWTLRCRDAGAAVRLLAHYVSGSGRNSLPFEFTCGSAGARNGETDSEKIYLAYLDG